MTAEQDAYQHIQSTLRRAEAIAGRPLTDDERATVLAWLAGWVDLLDAGMSPAAVAAIARQEAAAQSLH